MPAKDECPGSSGDKSGRVSQRKRIVVHLLDWHDSSFRRLLPPVTISIGRSRPVFATIAPDRDADDGANGYRGLQLTPSTNGIRAWWELLMVMNLATRLRGQLEDKRDSCQKFHKKREMTKLFRFHPIKEKRCLLKFFSITISIVKNARCQDCRILDCWSTFRCLIHSSFYSSKQGRANTIKEIREPTSRVSHRNFPAKRNERRCEDWCAKLRKPASTLGKHRVRFYRTDWRPVNRISILWSLFFLGSSPVTISIPGSWPVPRVNSTCDRGRRDTWIQLAA